MFGDIRSSLQDVLNRVVDLEGLEDLGASLSKTSPKV
jgi:hypothetical protein